MVLLPNNFLLLVALRCNSLGHPNDLGVPFLSRMVLLVLHKRAMEQVLLLAYASLEDLPDPQYLKIVEPVLITARGPLIAIISTFNHLPDFRP